MFVWVSSRFANDVGRLFLAAAAACVLAAPAWAAMGRVTVVAMSGDPTPDGNGTFREFRPPVVNGSGQVAFAANLTGTSNSGVFVTKGSSLLQVARSGQASPDGLGTLSIGFSSNPPETVALNDLGQVAFDAAIRREPGSDSSAILLGDGTNLEVVARSGQPAPGGNGQFSGLALTDLNQAGDFAFWANLTGTTGGAIRQIGRSDGATSVEIFRAGQSMPDGNGRLSVSFYEVDLNGSGDVAAYWEVAASAGGFADNHAILRGNGSSTVQIARTGQVAPGGSDVFQTLSTGVDFLNQSGQVAFYGRLSNTPGRVSSNGLFRGDGNSLVQLARTGQAVPDGNGVLADLHGSLDFNDAGQVAFGASLDGTTGGTADNQAIFRSDGASLVEVVRKGDPVPGGNGLFYFFSEPSMNEAGQVAFVASTSTIPGGPYTGGAYFYDDSLGTIEVVRWGDALAGSTISFLNVYAPGRGGGPVHPVYLSKSGTPRIAFRFFLADGRNGLALWTLVPEPGSLALVAIGGWVMCIIMSWPVRGARSTHAGD